MSPLSRSKNKIRALLEAAARQLDVVAGNEAIMAETPVEAQAAIETAAEAVRAALDRLERPVADDFTSTSLHLVALILQQGGAVVRFREMRRAWRSDYWDVVSEG